MKKFLCIVIVLLMFVTLSSCAISSGEQQNNEQSNEQKNQEESFTSEQVIDKINDSMMNQDSFEITDESTIVAYINGNKMTINSSAQKVVFLENTEIAYFYSDAEMLTKYDGAETKIQALEAFNEGKYFVYSAMGDDITKVYSELTAKEFEDFYNEKNENTEFTKGYTSISYEVESDGGYTVVLSKFINSFIDEFNSYYGFPIEDGGGKLKDYEVTISTDSNFLVTRVNVDYVFSNSSVSGNEIITFSNVNNAKKKINVINPEKYNKVEDARAVHICTSLLNDKKESKSETLRFLFDQYVYSDGRSNKHSQNNKLSYGIDENGKYYFELDSNIDGVKNTLSYINGIGLLNGEENDLIKYTDKEIKSIISEFVNPFGLSVLNAKNITVSEETRGTLYTLELDDTRGTMLNFLKSTYTSAGANYKSSNLILKFLVKDGELISIMYRITGEGYVLPSYQIININIEVTIEFLN